MYISTKPHKLDTHQFELIYCCIPVTKLEPECTSSLEHILQTQLPNFLHIITPHGKQGMKDAEWKISHALMDNYTKKVKVFVKDKWECSIINAFISKMPNLLGATWDSLYCLDIPQYSLKQLETTWQRLRKITKHSQVISSNPLILLMLFDATRAHGYERNSYHGCVVWCIPL